MTPEQIELARRLAAHPRWEWRPGMRWLSDDREYTPTGRVQGYVDDHFGDAACPDDGDYPDLVDAATAGVLLDMLPYSPTAVQIASGWHVSIGLTEATSHEATGATLGEACARVLLAVWGTP